MGIVRKVWVQMRWSLAQRGVLGTMRAMAARALRHRTGQVAVHPFDALHGVDTSGLIGGGELASGHANDRFTSAYYGIPPSRLWNALARWKATPGTRAVEEYTFLDIGCGKGRAMMLASELPFRSVAGVELNAGLAEVAAKNLKAWQEMGRAKCPVQLAQGDATEVVLPPLPLLVYLYNPFQAPVLRRLLERLDAAAGESNGGIDVLYLVPEQEAVFEDFARFKQLWSEVVAISEEDKAVDLVSTMEDRCNAYRHTGPE